MQAGAIDIHHHYVPQEVIGEAKRHGNALGVDVAEDKDGTIRISFASGPSFPLLDGLTDVDRRLEMMKDGKIALAALDPSTQFLGYDLKGEQAESWCRVYNECVKEFSENIRPGLPPWPRCRFKNLRGRRESWNTRSPNSIFAAPTLLRM
jgi:hypothetical protein